MSMILCAEVGKEQLSHFGFISMGETQLEKWISTLDLVFESRDKVETDFSYVQLIPYISIVLTHGKDSIYIAASKRIKGSGESRLHGKTSIGFGGHIEYDVWQNYPTKNTILDNIKLEAIRELKEELGISISPKKLTALGLISDNTSDVSMVHKGISFMVNMEFTEFASQCKNAEPDKHEIFTIDISYAGMVYENFEMWSKLQMTHIYSMLGQTE